MLKTILKVSPLVLSLSLIGVAQEPSHVHGPGSAEELGQVQFTSTCSAPVREQLSRAVAMLHSFWYDEAARNFQAVAEKDAQCGIAWWGVAMTWWHPLWEPRGPNPEAMQLGQQAIRKALAASPGSQRERDLIAALDAFYRDYEKVDHTQRVLAYEGAMRNLHVAHPADSEISAFYALALLGAATSSPPDKAYSRQKQAGTLLQQIFHDQPQHPGVVHYIIHAYDYPTLAAEALGATRHYAKVAPASAHALHMPSHIFTRLGLWKESISSNLDSAAAARKHQSGDEELHALDYLVFSYLQTGQDEQARAIRDKLPGSNERDPHYFAGLHSRAAIPARYVLERRQWAEAASLSAPVGFPGGRYAWAEANTYFARSLGSARTGKLDQARTDLQRLVTARETLLKHNENYWANQVEVQRRSASAWLMLAEGKPEEALSMMRSAVEMEDSMDKHPVTPGYVAPARHLLGELLLELKRPKEALAEYEKLLATEPDRFVALYGAARAAEMAGEHKQARSHYSRLLEVCGSPQAQRAELREARAFLAKGSQSSAQ